QLGPRVPDAHWIRRVDHATVLTVPYEFRGGALASRDHRKAARHRLQDAAARSVVPFAEPHRHVERAIRFDQLRAADVATEVDPRRSDEAGELPQRRLLLAPAHQDQLSGGHFPQDPAEGLHEPAM